MLLSQHPQPHSLSPMQKKKKKKKKKKILHLIYICSDCSRHWALFFIYLFIIFFFFFFIFIFIFITVGLNTE